MHSFCTPIFLYLTIWNLISITWMKLGDFFSNSGVLRTWMTSKILWKVQILCSNSWVFPACRWILWRSCHSYFLLPKPRSYKHRSPAGPQLKHILDVQQNASFVSVQAELTVAVNDRGQKLKEKEENKGRKCRLVGGGGTLSMGHVGKVINRETVNN